MSSIWRIADRKHHIEYGFNTLGSQGTPADRVNVTVTTSESIAMVNDPTFEAITTLEDKTTSFQAQGTVVQATPATPDCGMHKDDHTDTYDAKPH